MRNKEVRKNNKGFSLVELIVVIAIMAVLVGILAPQFIKYVDKSRRSTDIKNMQEYISAIQTYAADNDGLNDGTITLKKGADATINGADIIAALTDAGIDASKMDLSSGSWGDVTVTVSFDPNNSPIFTSTNTKSSDGKDGIYDFATQCGIGTTTP